VRDFLKRGNPAQTITTYIFRKKSPRCVYILVNDLQGINKASQLDDLQGINRVSQLDNLVTGLHDIL
jgi:hypothetical protein